MAGMSLKGKGILTLLYTVTEENSFNLLLYNKEFKSDRPHTVIEVRLNCVDSISRLDL